MFKILTPLGTAFRKSRRYRKKQNIQQPPWDIATLPAPRNLLRGVLNPTEHAVMLVATTHAFKTLGAIEKKSSEARENSRPGNTICE